MTCLQYLLMEDTGDGLRFSCMEYLSQRLMQNCRSRTRNKSMQLARKHIPVVMLAQAQLNKIV